jgi:hypothetical protein
MSDQNSDRDMAQWGRRVRKRTRGAAVKPADADTPVVGPVDGDIPVGGAETIIRAPRSEEPAVTPTYASAPAAAVEPTEEDFKLRDLVQIVARGLVDHPDDVSVEILRAGKDASFELHVHPDDLGHVIGKQGRTARSMRLTLSAAAGRMDRQAGLEIAD